MSKGTKTSTTKGGKTKATKTGDKEGSVTKTSATKKNESKVVESPVAKVVKTRHRPTIEEHIAHYDALLAMLDVEIDRRAREKEKGARQFRKARKLVVQMRKELPYISKAKLPKTRRNSAGSGLKKPLSISEELRAFLGLEEGEKISRIDVSRAICVYAHLKPDEAREEMLRWKHLNPKGKRNLQDPVDKKAIRPDAKLGELLGYERYRKDVAKGRITNKSKDRATGEVVEKVVSNDALYYWTIQRLINRHFIAVEPTKVEEGDEVVDDSKEDEAADEADDEVVDEAADEADDDE